MIATYIKSALQKVTFLKLNEEAHVRAGIKVAKKSFERLLWEKSKGKQVVVLDINGKDIRKFGFSKDILIVFGSAEGLSPKAEKFLAALKAEK